MHVHCHTNQVAAFLHAKPTPAHPPHHVGDVPSIDGEVVIHDERLTKRVVNEAPTDNLVQVCCTKVPCPALMAVPRIALMAVLCPALMAVPCTALMAVPRIARMTIRS